MITCRDAHSGMLRWKADVPLAKRKMPFANPWFGGDKTGGMVESVTLGQGKAFIASTPPVVLNLADGKAVSHQFAGTPFRFAVVGTTLLAYGHDRTDAYDAGSLAPKWSKPVYAYDAAVSGEMLVHLDTSMTPPALVARALGDGSERWRTSLQPYAADGKASAGRSGPSVSVRLVLAMPDMIILRSDHATKQLIRIDPRDGHMLSPSA